MLSQPIIFDLTGERQKELTNRELFSDKLRDELRPQTVELAREKKIVRNNTWFGNY